MNGSAAAATKPPKSSPATLVACCEYDSKYVLGVERISATFDERTLAAIRRVAGPRGVSRFLQVAARERLARLELLGMLDELDRKYGPVPDDVADQVAGEARRIFRRRR